MPEEEMTEDLSAKEWSDHWETPEFKHGMEVGESFGYYKAEQMAIAAYKAGEIDLYIQFITPKTMEGWKEWEAEHGKKFGDRWKTSE